MDSWITLITSLPTENATARMRAWRILKSSGAAVLRDGVYLMPSQPACHATLESVASDILGAGGTALLLRVEEPDGANFADLFDRTADYGELQAEISKASTTLDADTPKRIRKLHKAFNAVSNIDFFPGEARRQVEAALLELELATTRLLFPNEPQSVAGTVCKLDIAQYAGRIWATRTRPWIDRLASAWLIQRFIDSKATFLWLQTPVDCPAKALGFDFDGASFTHVGNRVTFEVLAASFGLDADRAIARIAAIVHYLDVGGVPVAEAPGVEAVLAGLHAAIVDDDQLLSEAGRVFDGLYNNFRREFP